MSDQRLHNDCDGGQCAVCANDQRKDDIGRLIDKINENGLRESLARILEMIGKDGLPGPRDLDVALDAMLSDIKAALTNSPIFGPVPQKTDNKKPDEASPIYPVIVKARRSAMDAMNTLANVQTWFAPITDKNEMRDPWTMIENLLIEAEKSAGLALDRIHQAQAMAELASSLSDFEGRK